MALGRPQEYNQDYIDKAKEYLENIGKDLPSIEGLAVFLEIHRSTIYDWKDKFADFSDILEKLLALQAEKLMNNGLQGKWNATISKLILTKHGYSDKSETDLTSKGEKLEPTVINIIKPVDSELQTESKTVSSVGAADGQADE